MIGTKGVYTLKRVSLDFFKDGMVAPQIPLDLISEILTRLPTKSVLRFKCVCKEWYNHINSPLFELKSQRNCILYWTNSTLYVVDDLYHPVNVTELNWPKDTIRDGERISQVGSCNGLVCFNVIGSRRYDTSMPCSTNKRFLICNPTTRTFKSICPPSEDTYLICGFGYDSEHDDYKIVGSPRCIWWEDDINKPVFIYSLKTDLWSSHTPLPRISTTGTNWIIIGDVILENNNMLHFLVSPIEQGSIERKIARFDVVSEKWIDGLSLPVQVSEFNHCYVRLGKLDGRLYLYDLHSNDIWMMEEDGRSWKKKMFNLPEILELHRVIARSKDRRRHRLLLHDYYGDGDVLKWFDQRNNKTIPLILTPSPEDRSTIMLCTATLIGIPGCSLKIKVAGNEGVRSSVLSFTCLLSTLSVLLSFYLLYSFTRFM